MKPTAYSLQLMVSSLRTLACYPRSMVNGLRSSFAFTLVELMVVVAVIAILVSLLVPNIRTMREKAWTSNCQNNLRQYGVAMNQYMVNNGGYYIYPGLGGRGGAGAGYDASHMGLKGRFGTRLQGRGGQSGSDAHWWDDMTAAYLPTGVTIQSLSEGIPSVRVCPSVLQQIKNEGNFFDPDSPNFKGLRDTTDFVGNQVVMADFERTMSYGDGYDANDKLILDPSFTTYAINLRQVYKNKKDIPEQVVSFIDWNARDGWGATITCTNWMFNGTNSWGEPVTQDTPKGTDGSWWLTEVGFHHLQDKVYGANFVAMDGHVGWIGSNKISQAIFTNSVFIAE